MRSYPWTVVLLAVGAAAQCRCDRYLCRTPFIGPVKNRGSTVQRKVAKSYTYQHHSTPSVTPKVIINGFPVWIWCAPFWGVRRHTDVTYGSLEIGSKSIFSDPRLIDTFQSIWLTPDIGSGGTCQKTTGWNPLFSAFWFRSGQNEYTYTIEEMPSQDVMQ